MLAQLQFASDADRADVVSHWRVMQGWRWNLIPMFVIQLAVTVLIFVEAFARRRRARADDAQRLSAKEAVRQGGRQWLCLRDESPVLAILEAALMDFTCSGRHQ